MVAPLLDGPAQVTVGSRYAAGGSAEGLEYRWRHWASVGSRWLVQAMFRETRRSSDPGGGLFAIRPEVLDGAALAPEGYKMLVEILVRGKWEVLVDVPYRFETRQDGQTKSTLVEGWNMIKHLVGLWWSTRVGWGPQPPTPTSRASSSSIGTNPDPVTERAEHDQSAQRQPPGTRRPGPAGAG